MQGLPLGVALASALGLVIHAASVALAADVYLTSGEWVRASSLTYDGKVLMAESPYGRLSIPKELLHVVVWDESERVDPESVGYLVFRDGTRVRAQAERIGPDGLVARAPWGWLVVSDIDRVRSVGFKEPERPQGVAPALWEFLLQDGGVVRGRVVRSDPRGVVVETAYGVMALPWESLAQLGLTNGPQSAQEAVVVFTNGDRIQATFQHATETAWVFAFAGGQLLVEEPTAVALAVLTARLQVPTPADIRSARSPTGRRPLLRVQRWVKVEGVGRTDVEAIPNIAVMPDASFGVVVTPYSFFLAEGNARLVDLATGETLSQYYSGFVTAIRSVLALVPRDQTSASVLLVGESNDSYWLKRLTVPLSLRTPSVQLSLPRGWTLDGQIYAPRVGSITSIAVASDGGRLILGTRKGPVKVADLVLWEWVEGPGKEGHGPSYVAVSPDDRWLVVAYAESRKLELYDIKSPDGFRQPKTEMGLDRIPTDVAVTRGGESVYVFDTDGFSILDPVSRLTVKRVPVAVGTRPLVLEDGRHALVQRQEAVCTVDLESGETLRCVRVLGLHSTVLGADGKTVYATGSEGITVMELVEGSGPDK